MKYFFFFLIFFSTSCTYLLKKTYGIKNPKIENEASILKYLTKVDMKLDNVYSYDYDSFLYQFKQRANVPDAYIFNAKGEYIPYGGSYACNASAFSFIEDLSSDKTYETKASSSLVSTVKGLTDLKGNPVDDILMENNDFYVFLYWTKFSGKLNKDHVKIWEDQALANTNASIKVVKVCMDFQEFWGEENLDKIKG